MKLLGWVSWINSIDCLMRCETKEQLRICKDIISCFMFLVKKASEELALAARDQTEVACMVGNNVNSISRGSSNSLNQSVAADTVKVAYADEFGTSVVTYNTAAVLYHLHEYACAWSFLEPLYYNIEPIDERTALHVCLLMLDIALASQDATRAAALHLIQIICFINFLIFAYFILAMEEDKLVELALFDLNQST